MREHQRKTLVSIVRYSSTPTHHLVHQAKEAAAVVWATPPLSSNREKEGTHRKFICSLVGSSTIADELSSISEGMWYLLTLCGLTNLINMLNWVVCRHLCELLRQWDLVCELSYSTIASSTPQKDCLLACKRQSGGSGSCLLPTYSAMASNHQQQQADSVDVSAAPTKDFLFGFMRICVLVA